MNAEPALSSLLSLPVRSPQEVRDWQFRNEVVPKLAALGFDSRFRKELPLSEDQWRVWRLCAANLCNRGAIVAMVGDRGTGKTTITAQIAIDRIRYWLDYYAEPELENRGKPPLPLPHYAKASDLVNRFKSLHADWGDINAAELAERQAWECREWGLLIIDEWHECDDQQKRDRVLVDLIDRRYSAQTDTVIISNQTPREFAAKTNASILSRLEEHGKIIPCKWASFRTKIERAQRGTVK